MVAPGDADALNLRHIRRHRGHLSSWPLCAQGRTTSARDAPDRRLPLSPKRTFNQVPAKTALVLTGSAIALAAYLGASSSDTGHDGRAVRPTGLAAALTASHQARATAILKAATRTTSTASTLTASTLTASTGSAPMALAAYGTAPTHPQPRHRPKPRHKHHPRRHPEHHAVKHHRARKHRARRNQGRLHGNPWQIAGSLMPAYHWTSYQFHYLNLLWMRESGWNRFAYNHSSGAYGIPQAVPGNKMAAAGPDWRTSARTQIIWGMGYIRSRYGNPWNAWQHELRYGWY